MYEGIGHTFVTDVRFYDFRMCTEEAKLSLLCLDCIGDPSSATVALHSSSFTSWNGKTTKEV